MEKTKIQNYIGVHEKLEIVDSTSIEQMSPDDVFIRVEASLVLPDGNKVSFANPEYLKFYNSPAGRTRLSESGINPKLIEAAFLLWGDKPTLPDHEMATE